MKKPVRKTWPKVRVVAITERTFYRIDARRTGTCRRQEAFESQREAETRAGEIAVQFGSIGKEGLSFPAELRGMALTADKMLRPRGKTLLQAAGFYVAHLQADQQHKDSALVPVLEAEAATRIFDAFTQANSEVVQKFGGLGLGLAISKATVNAHGGTPSARSEGLCLGQPLPWNCRCP